MTRGNRSADLVASEVVWEMKMAFPSGRVPTLAMGLIEALRPRRISDGEGFRERELDISPKGALF